MFLSAIILVVVGIGHPLAAEQVDSMDMHLAIISAKEAGPPRLIGRTVLFTYEAQEEPLRSVGIAFAHERYADIHTFSRNRHGTYVLPYEPPEGLDTLTYRLVVDGIWTSDPHAPQHTRTPEGIVLSSLSLPEPAAEQRGAPRQVNGGRITFTYRSESADRVAIVGDFNRWNPYLHYLREDPQREGVFTITLDLSPGTHYYYFVVDGRRLLDPNNPRRAVSRDGDRVSVYHVEG
jgi:hypothetical protein